MNEYDSHNTVVTARDVTTKQRPLGVPQGHFAGVMGLLWWREGPIGAVGSPAVV